jgi:hypothetical protein
LVLRVFREPKGFLVYWGYLVRLAHEGQRGQKDYLALKVIQVPWGVQGP